MADQYNSLEPQHREFIQAQHMYFVATAAAQGRVNLSPKGLDSLRVLGPNSIVWLNLTGSGNETAAHLIDNPRMTLMFCSFVREPKILRTYGTARALHPDDVEWEEHLARFDDQRGARNIFLLDVDLVTTSCGWGVPTYEFVTQRPLLGTWADKKGPDGLAEYYEEKNTVSLDGQPTRRSPTSR